MTEDESMRGNGSSGALGRHERSIQPRVHAVVDDPIPIWVAFLVLASVVLYRSQVVVTHHLTLYKLGVAVLFASGMLWTVPRSNKTRVGAVTLRLLALYLTIQGVAIIRGASLGIYTSRTAELDVLLFVVLAIFAVSFCTSAKTRDGLGARLQIVSYAPAFYVAANVLLRVFRNSLPFALPAAPAGAQGTSSELFAFIGVHSTRISFPLALGVNNFGAIAAAGMTAGLLLFFRVRRRRVLAALSTGLCLYAVLATDSRAPFFLSLAVVLLYTLRKRIGATKGLMIILPLSPVIALTTLGVLAGSGYLGGLSRQSGDLSTGNNRQFIWQSVFKVVTHPNGNLLFGWGGYGQVRSGVALQYAYLFGNDPITDGSHSSHNLALQSILDTGYVGLFVVVAVIVAAIRPWERLARDVPTSPAVAALGALLVLVLSGVTEALPTYQFPDTLALFVLFLGAAAGSRVIGSDREVDDEHEASSGSRPLASPVAPQPLHGSRY